MGRRYYQVYERCVQLEHRRRVNYAEKSAEKEKVMHLKTWGLEQRIRVYMLEEGEACADFIENTAVKFAIIGQAAELDPSILKTDYRLLELRKSIPVLQNLIYSDRWETKNVAQLDKAIDYAVLLRNSVRPFCINLVQITMKETL